MPESFSDFNSRVEGQAKVVSQTTHPLRDFVSTDVFCKETTHDVSFVLFSFATR